MCLPRLPRSDHETAIGGQTSISLHIYPMDLLLVLPRGSQGGAMFPGGGAACCPSAAAGLPARAIYLLFFSSVKTVRVLAPSSLSVATQPHHQEEEGREGREREGRVTPCDDSIWRRCYQLGSVSGSSFKTCKLLRTSSMTACWEWCVCGNCMAAPWETRGGGGWSQFGSSLAESPWYSTMAIDDSL